MTGIIFILFFFLSELRVEFLKSDSVMRMSFAGTRRIGCGSYWPAESTGIKP